MTYILEWMEETLDYTKAVMHFQAKAQIRWTKHNIYLIESQCNGHSTSQEACPPNNNLNDQYHVRNITTVSGGH
jgi:hypothetical protein